MVLVKAVSVHKQRRGEMTCLRSLFKNEQLKLAFKSLVRISWETWPLSDVLRGWPALPQVALNGQTRTELQESNLVSEGLEGSVMQTCISFLGKAARAVRRTQPGFTAASGGSALSQRDAPSPPNLLLAAASETRPCNLVSVF